MALLGIVDDNSDSLDRDDYSVGIFIDLSKAFDTVNHHILLRKLELYGIRGVALGWFTNYLTAKTQCVSLGEIISGSMPIECGVPQVQFSARYCFYCTLMILLPRQNYYNSLYLQTTLTYVSRTRISIL